VPAGDCPGLQWLLRSQACRCSGVVLCLGSAGGRNRGRVGIMEHRERHKGSFDICHVKDGGAPVCDAAHQRVPHRPRHQALGVAAQGAGDQDDHCGGNAQGPLGGRQAHRLSLGSLVCAARWLVLGQDCEHVLGNVVGMEGDSMGR